MNTCTCMKRLESDVHICMTIADSGTLNTCSPPFQVPDEHFHKLQKSGDPIDKEQMSA